MIEIVFIQDYVSIVPVFYPGPDHTEGVPEKRSESVLEDTVTRACEVNGENDLDDLCVQYSYVGVNKPGFVRIQAEEGYAYDRVARKQKSTQVFSDQEILKELDFSALALLNKNQVRLNDSHVYSHHQCVWQRRTLVRGTGLLIIGQLASCRIMFYFDFTTPNKNFM